jgi:hypothetical protein
MLCLYSESVPNQTAYFKLDNCECPKILDPFKSPRLLTVWVLARFPYV